MSFSSCILCVWVFDWLITYALECRLSWSSICYPELFSSSWVCNIYTILHFIARCKLFIITLKLQCAQWIDFLTHMMTLHLSVLAPMNWELDTKAEVVNVLLLRIQIALSHNICTASVCFKSFKKYIFISRKSLSFTNNLKWTF